MAARADFFLLELLGLIDGGNLIHPAAWAD